VIVDTAVAVDGDIVAEWVAQLELMEEDSSLLGSIDFVLAVLRVEPQVAGQPVEWRDYGNIRHIHASIAAVVGCAL